jgi:hypothetical protein
LRACSTETPKQAAHFPAFVYRDTGLIAAGVVQVLMARSQDPEDKEVGDDSIQ